MAVELYAGDEGWLQRVDPRVKLAGSLLATVLLASAGALWLLLAWLVASNAALYASRVGGARLRWAWLTTLPVLVSIAVLWPVFAREGADPLVYFGPVDITVAELARGGATALRIAGLAFAWLGLLFTTDQSELVRAIVKLGVPHRTGLVLVLALRSIWLLQEIHSGVMDAQQARGLMLRSRNPIAQAKARLPVLVAVLVNAARMMDALTLALSARGYDSRGFRTSYREPRMRTSDWALLLAGVLGTAIYLWARVTLGVASAPLSLP